MTRWTWSGEHVVDGQVLFRIGRSGDELVAEWPGLCELRSDRRGQRVSFVPAEGADERIVGKVRAGLGAALVRHLHGETSLHASAVERQHLALGFLGASGAGKSTLAAWMCHRRGWALVADDIVSLRVEERATLVVPTERDHWLDRGSRAALDLRSTETDTETEKEPIAAPVVAREPARLKALVALAYGADQGVSLSRLRGQRALGALLPCLVRFVLDEPDVQIAEMKRLEDVLAHAPLYELRAPRDLAALPHVVDALEALE